MIKVKSNIALVGSNILKKLEILKDREYLLRPVAFDVIALMTTRIHQEGKKADDSQIGQYSSSYLKQRESKFKRGSDSKVIFSLTRQLENDWSVIATAKGYGIGFLNPFNRDKAKWLQEGRTAHAVPAHTRTMKVVKGKGKKKTVETKKVAVGAHNRKGSKGFGIVFQLSESEKEFAIERLQGLIRDAINS